MAPKKWIDKKTAETYSLRHRSYEDARYNDADAPEHVLVKVDRLNNTDAKSERRNKYGPRRPKAETGGDLQTLEEEFRAQGQRENEGEAALYGIAYDDSKYDYMQHLRPIGQDPDAIFIAKKDQDKNKGKKGDIAFKKDEIVLPADVLPGETVKRTYQDQQNVPDEIAGLQPDMDPRLREVLEALEDEEFIGAEGGLKEEDLFAQLVTSGKVEEEELDEWDDPEFDVRDHIDFSDSDDERNFNAVPQVKAKEGEEEWETQFRQFKLEQSIKPKEAGSDDGLQSEAGMSDMSSFTVGTHATKGNSRRRRKMFKKGAMTALTGASMSSSAIHRNKGLTFLDDRFEAIMEEYEEEEEDDGEDFDITKERPDLEAAMDDFLNNYTVEGKHLYKRK